jgi:capsular polysaccharide biosynthesis protein
MRSPLDVLRRRRRPADSAESREATIGAVTDERAARLLLLATKPLERGRARVLLLAGAEPTWLVEAVRAASRTPEIIVLDPAVGPESLHVELAARGPLDLIVDLTDDPADVRADRARAVLFHLRHSGVLVVADAVGEPIAEVVADAVRAAVAPDPDELTNHERFWGRAVENVSVRFGHVALTNGLRGLAQVREEQAAEYLRLRGPGSGQVLVERPGSVVENPAPILASEHDDATTYATRFEAPPMQLREYADVVCWPGQVVVQGHALLPETYRHGARAKLGNRFLDDLAPDFGRVSSHATPGELEGTYFHLDSEFRGHFGHALTEQIARLWAWPEAKRRHPELKALMLTNRKRTTVAGWEYRLYQAAGVAPEDLVLADRPVRVERLLAGTPMFSQPEYIHADITEVYRRIGDDLAAEAPERDYPDRIFCSRRTDKRSCHNTPDVEAFFADRGFEVIYPEDYPLPEQVQMFRSATELAGFGGSAMFTMAFVPTPKRVFLVSSENYRAQNEALMAAVHGHQLNVAWCRPDKTRAAGYKGREAMHSQYTFDPSREGRFLAGLLD